MIHVVSIVVFEFYDTFIISESPNSNRSTSRIFYNRVPKCASGSTNEFLRIAAHKNNVNTGSSNIFTKPYLKSADELKQFLTSFYKIEEPALYDRHLYFVDFERYECIYIGCLKLNLPTAIDTIFLCAYIINCTQ